MTVDYKLAIRTSAKFGAGTNATISVVLVGTHGESEPHTLDKRFHNDFEAGAEDVYTVKAQDLGELLLLRFTNAGGLASDWLLDSVRVTAGERSWYFPHFRWVLHNSTAEVLEGTARLPQHLQNERAAKARREQLEGRQQMYPWRPAEATANLPGALDISKERPLPKDELYRGLSDGSYEVVIAKTLAALKLHMPVLTKAWNGLVDVLGLLKHVEVPQLAQRWQDDHEFARQAVQGINPVHIQLITALPQGLPLSDGDVRGLLSPGSTLEQALATKRVFLLDFEILEDIPMFKKVDKEGVEERRWAPASRCLLYLDDTQQLRPIAIQLGRDPQKDPVFTPNDSEHDWLAAKIYVRCSEGNTHQMVAHALRTHFVAEPFVMATMRNLPDPHPVYKLMRRHFRYTLAINEGARQGLLAEGGVFDDFIATGGPDKGHLRLGMKGYERWKLTDNRPRPDFERRGVLEKAILPYYPYRDDTLPLWDAIEEYVGGVLRHFYKSDADLVSDAEMQAWWKDLTERGLPADKLPCTKLERVADLVDILATVIFTVSVQHAAVNYLQYEHYGFVPNAPLCMRREPPREKGALGPDDIAEMIPSKSQTLWQIAIGRALSSFGDDEEYLLNEGGWHEDYFKDPELAAIRDRFHDRLRTQLAAVKARNAKSEVPYTVLQPDKIPCGITV
ncbi:lipoxygenase family protein [Vitiosangium sp. GDMCC 1.1324]|uniref:lipoxygenase family protein n=1 Tax=Vitiosangium sp. (strain GDMCC 1.1324) TaxID=2138576 RepID=UPI000D3D0DF4|nr:lipoxygenase family protein [Vitiosangium sp. GDMCC 1.1324]PTL81540.1 lipoxygenase [Vitiosangium sp. GDMCC 1.1324]